MNILFTICARAGSKGFKSKNIKSFLGYPLSFYALSIINLYIMKNPDQNFTVAINSDSDEFIDQIINQTKMKVVIVDRKPNLASDNVAKLDVIRDTFSQLETKDLNFDQIIDLDVTSPLRKLDDLESVIHKKLVTNSDLVFTVTESRRNPYFNMVKFSNHKYSRVIESSFNARQEAPIVYDMNASIYSFSPDFLKKKNSLFESNFEVVEMLDTFILDIDSERDFLFMELIAQRLFDVDQNFSLIRNNISNILK
jgi:CMP-N,N'-diacetyllegionaminic acid synthase